MYTYAVFQNGGKQYRVSQGEKVVLESINAKIGDCLHFKKVLMIVENEKVRVGNPFIKKCMIKAKIIAHGRSNKVSVVKFKRRKHYKKIQGHRQWFTNLEIIEIITC